LRAVTLGRIGRAAPPAVSPGRRREATLFGGENLAHERERDAAARCSDLAGIRDAEALAKLPEPERQEWQALWADVDSLLAKIFKP
jgi:hypothetical protein